MVQFKEVKEEIYTKQDTQAGVVNTETFITYPQFK